MHVNISPPLAPVRPRPPLLGEDGGGRKAERTGAEKKKIVHYLSTCCPLLVYMAVHIVVHIHNHEKNSPLLDRLYTPLLLLCLFVRPRPPLLGENGGGRKKRENGAEEKRRRRGRDKRKSKS